MVDHSKVHRSVLLCCLKRVLFLVVLCGVFGYLLLCGLFTAVFFSRFHPDTVFFAALILYVAKWYYVERITDQQLLKIGRFVQLDDSDCPSRFQAVLRELSTARGIDIPEIIALRDARYQHGPVFMRIWMSGRTAMVIGPETEHFSDDVLRGNIAHERRHGVFSSRWMYELIYGAWSTILMIHVFAALSLGALLITDPRIGMQELLQTAVICYFFYVGLDALAKLLLKIVRKWPEVNWWQASLLYSAEMIANYRLYFTLGLGLYFMLSLISNEFALLIVRYSSEMVLVFVLGMFLIRAFQRQNELAADALAAKDLGTTKPLVSALSRKAEFPGDPSSPADAIDLIAEYVKEHLDLFRMHPTNQERINRLHKLTKNNSP